MNNKIATVISSIFHPMFIPLYGIIILLNLDYFFFYFPKQKIFIISLVFVFTCVIPGLATLILYKLKLIDSIHVSNRKQRYAIYVITFFSYAACVFLFWKVGVVLWLQVLAVLLLALLMLLALVNLFWKISIHAAAIGAFTGSTFYICYLLQINPVWFLIIAISISGYVLSSRLQLKAHTLAQVICGYTAGLLMPVIPFLF